jgi:hypothetical protein
MGPKKAAAGLPLIARGRKKHMGPKKAAAGLGEWTNNRIFIVPAQ